MAFERRDNEGGAIDTELAADITSGATTATLAAATGWPSGGASGEFFIAIGVIDPVSQRFVSNQETIRVGSRTGTGLSGMTRGLAGTSAAAHVAGETVRHIFSSVDADEANYAVSQTVGKVTTKGDLLAATGANALERRGVGANGTVLVADSGQATGMNWATLGASSLAADSVGSSQIQTNAVGAAELADNAVDTNAIANLAVTAAKIANDTITASQIAADAIGTPELAANAVGTSELADNAVDAGAIAAGAVTTVKIGDDQVTAAKIADGAIDHAAQIVDAILTLAKFTAFDPTSFAPSAASFSSGANLTVGTGGTTYGYYVRFGNIVFGWVGFSMAADGNLPAASSIRIPVPFNQKALTTMRGFVAARARLATGLVVSGTGVIQAGNNYGENIAAAGTSAEWDATVPFNWGTPGDGAAVIDAVFFMVAA